ncbi:TBCC domain-containing protein 1-like isoform X2 [Oratosquilla oratoria]|uniref:TBCC domain-containing protein 1-like isoform X2 n=1 Tax=Oratosquilla oratoria TaxID=337810 RepID=UPI003F75F8A4
MLLLTQGSGRDAGMTYHPEDELMSEAQVSTLELVLLLYLHRSNTYSRVVARQASLQSLTNDPWPNGNAGQKKQLQEERNLQFIKEYLPEMLNLLAGQGISVEEGESEKKSVRELLGFMRYAGVFSVQVVAALSFLIGVTLPKDKSEKDLLAVAKDKYNGYRSGFLSKKNAFQRGLFEGWILNALDWCPDGEGTCIRRGRRQSWPLIRCSAQSSYRLVASSSTGKRLVYLCDLIDGLTAHMADDIAHSNVKIRRCHKSNIYILQPLRYVVIHKCHETRVVLGPVGGRVKISECRNSVVVCAARSLVITECRNMTIYTLTPQRPLILGTRSQGITLAPLNMHYPHLHKHMASLGLQPSINMWNRPLFLGCEGIATSSTCCQLMAAEDFFLLTVPFVKPPQDNRPPLLPPGLPQEFAKSVEEAGRNVISFRSEVKDANLTTEQRVVLQKSVDSNFKKWLKESGHQRELDQLEKLNALLRYERAAKTTAI